MRPFPPRAAETTAHLLLILQSLQLPRSLVTGCLATVNKEIRPIIPPVTTTTTTTTTAPVCTLNGITNIITDFGNLPGIATLQPASIPSGSSGQIRCSSQSRNSQFLTLCGPGISSTRCVSPPTAGDVGCNPGTTLATPASQLAPCPVTCTNGVLFFPDVNGVQQQLVTIAC